MQRIPINSAKNIKKNT